jgi:cobalt-zinc-cadmium efflux system outer membrane protein
MRRNVTIKWWQVAYMDRAIKTIHRNQVLLRQFITVARTKYETGKGLQQDVLLAQLELSKLLDQEIQLNAMRRTQAIALNVLMDRLPSIGIILPEKISTQMPSIIDEEALGVLAGNERARLKQMQAKVESAQARLKAAKRDYYPDFMVGMNYGDRSGSNPLPRGGGREDFASLMIGIKVPLYAKRKQARAVAQRNSEVDMSRHALRNEKGNVLAQVSIAVTDYQRAKEQFMLFESGIIPQAQQTVSSMLAGYQVNQVDFLNLVRSQITLFNYELQYWKALSEANQALARLQAAVGKEPIYE